MNYLSDALDGWERPDKETYRERAGAFLFSFETVRWRLTDLGYTAVGDGEMSEGRYRHFVHHLVRDAFALLAKVREVRSFDPSWKGRDFYTELESRVYDILICANEGDKKGLLTAADHVAVMAPEDVNIYLDATDVPADETESNTTKEDK